MTLTLLRNGRIHTGADPDATAMAIADSMISWIGGEHAVGVAGTPDRVIDLHGALVIPGFVDAHVHTTDAGLALIGLDLSRTRSLAECLAAIAASTPHATRTACCGDTAGRRPGGRRIGRRPGRRSMRRSAAGPVYLSRVDVHSALVSSALAALVPEPAGAGRLVGLPGRSPNRPTPRCEPLPGNTSRPATASEAQLAFLRAAAGTGHRRGARVRRRRRDRAGPTWPRCWRSTDRCRSAATWPPRSPTRSRPGSCWPRPARTRSAATSPSTAPSGPGPPSCHAPYQDAPGSRGVRYLTNEQITDHLVACTVAGVQAGFHAIGEDAVSAVGRSLRAAAAGWGSNGTVRLAGCAHRVEHAEMVDDETIAAFAATGTVASMQPLFDAAWGGPDGLYTRRLGADRAAGDESVRDDGHGRGRLGLRLGRTGDGRGSVGGGAGGGAPSHPRQRAVAAERRSPPTPAAGTGRPGGPTGGSAPSASARRRTWRSSAPANWSGPATDPSVARWSTDPRSRVPLLPDLTPGVDLPRTLATLVDGRIGVRHRPVRLSSRRSTGGVRAGCSGTAVASASRAPSRWARISDCARSASPSCIACSTALCSSTIRSRPRAYRDCTIDRWISPLSAWYSRVSRGLSTAPTRARWNRRSASTNSLWPASGSTLRQVADRIRRVLRDRSGRPPA